MKTVRTIAKETRDTLVQGTQVTANAAQLAISAATIGAKNAIISSDTALKTYSIFQQSSMAVNTGISAIAMAVMSQNNS